MVPISLVLYPNFKELRSFLQEGVNEGARWPKWLEREFTDRKVRGSNPTSASRLPLSRLEQPGNIPALVQPSGGMAARHQKDRTAPTVKVKEGKRKQLYDTNTRDRSAVKVRTYRSVARTQLRHLDCCSLGFGNLTLPCHKKRHESWDTARLLKPRQGKSRGRGRVRTTDPPFRGSNPTSATRLPLSRLGQPGSIQALVLPSGGVAARRRKGAIAERFLSFFDRTGFVPLAPLAHRWTCYAKSGNVSKFSSDGLTVLSCSPIVNRKPLTMEKNHSAVATFRLLAVMPHEGAGILPGCPSIDRGSREAQNGFERRSFRLGQPGSILALVLPSGGMAVRHRKGATAERFIFHPPRCICLPARGFAQMSDSPLTWVLEVAWTNVGERPFHAATTRNEKKFRLINAYALSLEIFLPCPRRVCWVNGEILSAKLSSRR
ncbi:hypothetical protein T265_00679 [Opisthorchis viverrini]|uniref:Uncharacterized protein n=1 Tax=Opisthorchis viverrini TaxID=6198 RepID=A0A075A0W0_OPIVI|nr:hypothetical protein T265_00679 [Opisthorchis viverrini]KER33353.1 hypothetical protein T265_00679 [Opisthorchis viverrini]